MEVKVGFLARKRSGSVSVRTHELRCDVIHFGRSAECEVHLGDPRISQHHATLSQTPGGFRFEALRDTGIVIDGVDTGEAIVKPGSVIQLGPYEVKLLEPGSGVDLDLTVELTMPLAEELDELRALNQTALEDTWPNRRQLSWLLALVILGLFLAWPVGKHFVDSRKLAAMPAPMEMVERNDRIWPVAANLAWDTGEISTPHKFIANNCNACHRKPFEQVTDAVCIACHADTRHHVDTKKYPLPEISQAACQSCHKEHQGPAPIVRNDQQFCASCHGDIQSVAKGVDLGRATDFGTDHPEFRPLVMVDGRTKKRVRMTLDPKHWPVEKSNLNFSHVQHLDPKGMRVPNKAERKVLVCADCHTTDATGRYMKPITMEKQCASCHLLQFDARAPDRTVVHGSVELTMRTMREFYSTIALEGGAMAEGATTSLRRRPGAPLTENARREAVAWAERMTAQAAEQVFGKSVCKTCHQVTRSVEKGRTKWEILPVTVASRWMEKGEFDHARHESMECADCHDAAKSKKATDVLLPRIATCQKCHAGEGARSKVASTCVTCHAFHLPNMKPMRPELVKAAERRK